MTKKKIYKAYFPGIGITEIPEERTEQIKRLQKLIKENNQNKMDKNGSKNKT